MNLIEAIKTGKRFRRRGYDEWRAYPVGVFRFELKDILAEDWEVEKEKKIVKAEVWANIYRDGSRNYHHT